MIPGVPSMGGAELLIILAIVLLFFGAKRVPQLGRSLGSGYKELRAGLAGAGEDNEDEAQDHKKKKEEEEEEEPSLNGAAAHGEMLRTEDANAPSTGQKS